MDEEGGCTSCAPFGFWLQCRRLLPAFNIPSSKPHAALAAAPPPPVLDGFGALERITAIDQPIVASNSCRLGADQRGPPRREPRRRLACRAAFSPYGSTRS